MENENNISIEEFFYSIKSRDPVDLSIRNFENELISLENYGLDVEALKKSSLEMIKFSFQGEFNLDNYKEFYDLYEKEIDVINFKNKFLDKKYLSILVPAALIYILLVDLRELLKSEEIYEFSNNLSTCSGILMERRINGGNKKFALKGVSARHKENRSCKKQVFKWLDENMHLYKSMDDAASAIAGKLVPMKFRTVRQWLTEWKKLRSAGTT